MRHMKTLVAVLMVLLLLSLTLACDLAGNDADGGNTTPTIAAYKEVRLSDLSPLGVDDYLPHPGYPDDLVLDENAMMLLMQIFGENWGYVIFSAAEYLDDGYAFLPTRSVAASFWLSVRDEGFAIVGPDEPYPIGTEFDIDIFDVLLAGRLNSLSSLIGLLGGADSFPVEVLEADGTIGLSAFVSGETSLEMDPNLAVVAALYANVSIEHSEPLESEEDPSTIISGKLNFSYGTNHAVIEDEEYRMPSVLQMDVRQFSIDIADAEFQTFWSQIADDGPQDDDDWNELVDFIWGTGHRDDCVEIRWRLGDAAGAEGFLGKVEGVDALKLLVAFIEGMGKM